jgi:hypothetical protein
MPKAEVLEYEVGNRTVRLSSPDRMIFPERGFTKKDVFEFYLAVQEPMLRGLNNRPTTLQRFPEGIDDRAGPHPVGRADGRDRVPPVAGASVRCGQSR